MLVLTERDVAECLEMADVVPVVADALAAYAAGHVHSPVRAEIRSADPALLGLFMPALLPSAPGFGQKTVVESKSNAERGLPVLTATLTLHDVDTGLVAALLAATHLTNVRTGALAGLAAQLYAPAGARRATLLGTGGISRSLAVALATTLELEALSIWGRRYERAQEVAESLVGHPGVPQIEVIEDASQAVRGSDVIVTATAATEPLFSAADVEANALICAMGSNSPAMCEVPPALLGEASLIVADTRAGVIERAGELVRAIDAGHIRADDVLELGDAVRGSVPSRRADDKIIVFKSCGTAIVDIAVGAATLAEARRRGLGLEVDLGQEWTAASGSR